MRVFIDINGLADKSGLGIHVRMLVSHLAAIDSKNEYVLYLHQWGTPDRAALDPLIPKQANFRVLFHRVPNSLSIFSEYKLGFPLTELLLDGRPGDVFHGPSNMLPKLARIPSLITFHHYISVRDPLFPQNINARTRAYFDAAELSAKAATRVIAISQTTRRDIIEKLGLAPEKVGVVYPGGPQPAFRRVEGAALTPRLAERLPGRFVLFAGPLNERKNLPAFLEAFAAAKDRLGGARLALTGRPTPEFGAAAAEQARRLGLGEDAVFLGEVTDEEMVLLYNRALCLAYPSKYEGFGTPPLEAMACGCPVIASNATSIPEITGGAALLFDPDDRKAMADALVRIAGDEALRRELVEKGSARAQDFSWRRMAEETRRIYGEMAR